MIEIWKDIDGYLGLFQVNTQHNKYIKIKQYERNFIQNTTRVQE